MSAYIRKLNDSSANVIFPATRAEAVYFADDSILEDYVSSEGVMNKSLGDKNGKDITTYLTGLSVSGKTITYTRGNGTSGTISTQDTTYSTFKAASSSAAGGSGLVPAPGTGANTKFLRGDATWAVPTNTTYNVFGKATADAGGSTGLVPAPAAGDQAKYLRADGTWATPTNTTYGVASQSSNGLMSSTDKTKLDGIATGANKYVHPSYTAKSSGLYKVTVDSSGHVSAATAVTKSDITALGIPAQDTNTTYNVFGGASSSSGGSAGLVPAPSAGDQSKFLRADGTWVVPTNTTYSNFKAATASTAGGAGLVPAPGAGAQSKFLRADATWQTPTNTTYSNATTSADGLMSSEDKTKLDGIASGATKVIVDSALSSTSTNAVQNKVINTALAGKASTSHTHQNFTISLNGTSQGAYNGSAAKSINITASSIGAAAASHTHSGFVTVDSSWGSTVTDIP